MGYVQTFRKACNPLHLSLAQELDNYVVSNKPSPVGSYAMIAYAAPGFT